MALANVQKAEDMQNTLQIYSTMAAILIDLRDPKALRAMRIYS